KNMHGDHADHNAHHGHKGHVAMDYVDETSTELDVPRFDEFVSDQVGNQIAVVSVTGMVCDFCARGIEKTFQEDAGFKKIDVDLDTGKVLIAYTPNTEIINEEIEKKILSNGQTVTDIQILTAQ
ncbi:MAG: heavy metal-associated domain-containing protein, partial [Pseudomonadota bacterium]|nr:heavy metal-associated domain-containing protein [Pseudomonadota bacterium]